MYEITKVDDFRTLTENESKHGIFRYEINLYCEFPGKKSCVQFDEQNTLIHYTRQTSIT